MAGSGVCSSRPPKTPLLLNPELPVIDFRSLIPSHEQCCVPHCFEHHRGRSLHVLPKDEMIKQKWLDFLGPGVLATTRRIYICSAHFTQECWGNGKKRKRLLFASIPTIRPGSAGDNDQLSIAIRRIAALEHENQYLKSHENKVRNTRDILEGKLTSGQLDRLTGHRKLTRWTDNERSLGMALEYFSRPGYEYLTHEMKYPLPRPSTLRRVAGKLELRHGFLDGVLQIMAARAATMEPFEKVCVLLYDEMYTRQIYEYDKRHDDVVGPHRRVQVIMVRGLFGSWKQPIFAGFDTNMTSDLLFEAITRCHTAGFEVVAVTSDCASSNVKLWNDLFCLEAGITHFRHPITDENVYAFADAPHLLKLVRNWLLDTGYTFRGKPPIDKEPLKQLINQRPYNTELSSSFYLSEDHLDCESNDRMHVALAAQLLSRKTVSALQNDVNTKEAHELANFIEIVNDWWDVVNARYPDESLDLKKPFGLSFDKQMDALNEMEHMVSNMLPSTKTEYQVFQKGILMSIISLRRLFRDMKQRFRIKFIMTVKVNQDALENLFSLLRGRGGGHDHPSPMETLQRLRIICLGKLGTFRPTGTGRNTLDRLDDESFLSSEAVGKATSPSNVQAAPPSTDIEAQDEYYNDIMKRSARYFINQNDGFVYVVGAVGRKFLKRFPYIGSRAKDAKTTKHLQYLSLGGLVKPSIRFLNQASKMEAFFQKFHGKTVTKGVGVVNTIAEMFERHNPDSPIDVIKMYFRLRIYIRIKILNKPKPKPEEQNGSNTAPIVYLRSKTVPSKRIMPKKDRDNRSQSKHIRKTRKFIY